MNISNKNSIILGIGSNISPRKSHIQGALRLLKKYFHSEIVVSSIYQSQSWGFKSEQDFLNCCVYFQSSLDAYQILSLTQQIEKEIGRKHKSVNQQYASRKIDIDILYIENQIISTSELTIPHPLIYHRKFVLIPLQEILPDFIDPVKKDTISNLLRITDDSSEIERLE